MGFYRAKFWYRERQVAARSASEIAGFSRNDEGDDEERETHGAGSNMVLRVTSKVALPEANPTDSGATRKRWFLVQIVEMQFHSVLHNLFSSIGACVGTLVLPGNGTLIGVQAGDLAAGVAVPQICKLIFS